MNFPPDELYVRLFYHSVVIDSYDLLGEFPDLSKMAVYIEENRIPVPDLYVELNYPDGRKWWGMLDYCPERIPQWD